MKNAISPLICGSQCPVANAIIDWSTSYEILAFLEAGRLSTRFEAPYLAAMLLKHWEAACPCHRYLKRLGPVQLWA